MASVNSNVPANATTPVNSNAPASSVGLCTQLFSTITGTPPDKSYGYTTSSSDSPESTGSGSKSPSVAKSSSSSDHPYKNVRGRVTGTQASKATQDKRGKPKGQPSPGDSKPPSSNQSGPPIQNVGSTPVPNPLRHRRTAANTNRGQRQSANAGRTQGPQYAGRGRGPTSCYRNTKNQQLNRQTKPDFR